MSRGILLMAYGTPESPDQVEAYYTHIRGGRTPSPESVARLQQRYALVGGRTPLLEISSAVRDALEQRLNGQSGDRVRVYIGMKHWHPFIGDVIARVAADGISELTAVALAPHYSRISIGGYRKAVDDAVGKTAPALGVRFVDSWHLNTRFLDLVADRVREGLQQWPARERKRVAVVFSAHSLPERIREWNDPYEQQLLDSCREVARRVGIDGWVFAWQSAGETGEKWLGPDILEVLETLHGQGIRDVLSVPIGFVSDHLEIAYDIDHEAQAKARELGLTLHRTRMPNADPAFIETLASVISMAT